MEIITDDTPEPAHPPTNDKYEIRIWPYEWGESGRDMGFAFYYGHGSSILSMINDIKEAVEDIHALPPITRAKRYIDAHSRIKRVQL